MEDDYLQSDPHTHIHTRARSPLATSENPRPDSVRQRRNLGFAMLTSLLVVASNSQRRDRESAFRRECGEKLLGSRHLLRKD
jgi:hypothetical protein